MREETPERIDWVVCRARVGHRRPGYRRSYTFKVRGAIVHTKFAKPIRKGLFSSRFLARLLIENDVLGRALRRMCAALSSEGLDTSRQVFAKVVGNMSNRS